VNTSAPPASTVAGIALAPAHERPKRFSALIWGPPGTGKTTLACTAPGKKLLLSFDPDGASSLMRQDVHVADMSTAPNAVADRSKGDDPFGLRTVLADFDTLIIDSLTNFAHKALMYGVSQVRGASIEQPTQQGWGYRTTLTLQLVKNITLLTARLSKHVIFTAHEGAPGTNSDGSIAQVTVMLGGALPTSVPVDINEMWHLSDTGRERRIALRPVRNRTPMKTRMFLTGDGPEFVWRYDPQKPDDDPANRNMRIADWYDAWAKSPSGKISLPR